MKAAVQIRRQRRPDGSVSLGGGVAVEPDGVQVLEEGQGGVPDGLGGGDAGVAQGEVLHVLGANLCDTLLREGEGFADLGAGGTEGQHPLRESCHVSVLSFVVHLLWIKVYSSDMLVLPVFLCRFIIAQSASLDKDG